MALLLEGTHLPIDILELGMTIRVVLTFLGLPVGLQAVPQVCQQRSDRLVTYRMTLLAEFVGHSSGALGGPVQRRLRVSPCGRFDQGLQVGEDGRIVLLDRMPAAAWGSNPLRNQVFLGLIGPSLQLAPTGPDRGPR